MFANSGMTDLARRLGVELIDLNQATRRPVPWRYGELGLPTVILDADYYVNVPKMKTHVRCGVTLSLKNQQGSAITRRSATTISGASMNRSVSSGSRRCRHSPSQRRPCG